MPINEPGLTKAGWPRPIVGGTPIPWVAPAGSLSVTDPSRRHQVITQRLCQICGLHHAAETTVYFLVLDHSRDRNQHEGMIAIAMDDAIMHKKCLELALAHCPLLGKLRKNKRLIILATRIEHIEQFEVDNQLSLGATQWSIVTPAFNAR